ncbi:MAG: porin family protein [Clostridium sp.]|nr:porin family protein [Clostridium sp.]
MQALLRRLTMLAAIAITAVALGFSQSAPYKFDLGGGLGMSGYLGDANGSTVFKHPGFSVEAGMRYLPNVRWAFRGLLGLSTLSGNTADMDNALPGGAQYSFTSKLVTFGARAEFNFLPYGIGETYKKLSRWSPYLVLGVGVSLASCDGETSFAPTIPMGAGIKYKLKPRLNLSLEWTMTKVIGDKADGPNLSDLTGIKTSFIKNTDWCSRIMIGLTYEFGERCETCNYKD